MAQFSPHISEIDFNRAARLTSAERLEAKILRIRVKLVPKSQGVLVLEICLPGPFVESDEQILAFPLPLPVAKYLSDQLKATVKEYLNSYDSTETE